MLSVRAAGIGIQNVPGIMQGCRRETPYSWSAFEFSTKFAEFSLCVDDDGMEASRLEPVWIHPETNRVIVGPFSVF